MQVFRYYFKIAKSLRSEMLVYIGAFVLASILMMTQIPSQATFMIQKPNVAIFNRDDGEFADGLTKYLQDNARLVEIVDNTDARKDAVFFQTVDAIYTIPADFSRDFFASTKPHIETMRGSGQGAMQADTLVNNYLRLAEPRILAGMDQQMVVEGVAQDVSKQIAVVTKSAPNINEVGKTMYYMNTLVYILLGLNIMVVSIVMLLFSRDMIRRRNLVSGLASSKISAQLFAGNALTVVAIWFVFQVIAFILNPQAMGSSYGLLYAAGSFLFSLVCLAIGFMAGSLVSNRRVLPGIINVVSLGMSFLCGVFVPQQFLGESVVAVSKALPAYWYVHANGLIATLTDFSFGSLRPIFFDWLVLLGFTLALMLVTYVILRRRAQHA